MANNTFGHVSSSPLWTSRICLCSEPFVLKGFAQILQILPSIASEIINEIALTAVEMIEITTTNLSNKSNSIYETVSIGNNR